MMILLIVFISASQARRRSSARLSKRFQVILSSQRRFVKR
jgi:hypothetical protein